MSAARRVASLLLLNFAFAIAFDQFAKGIQAPGGPHGTDLELSFMAGTFRQILGIWAEEHKTGVQAFKLSILLLDFLFPIAYAAFLGKLYEWVVTIGGGEPLRFGRLAPWIAAGFDWVENVLLLTLLCGIRDADGITHATLSPWLVGLMSTAAAIKFALLLVPVALGSLPLIFTPQGQDLLVSLADRTASGFVIRVWFFVFLVIWSASVWYWARVLLMVRFEANAALQTPDEIFFATWTPRVLGTATLALAGVAFLRASMSATRWSGTFWLIVEWVSPLRALLAVRQARGSLALAELRREENLIELGVYKRLAGACRATTARLAALRRGAGRIGPPDPRPRGRWRADSLEGVQCK